MKPNHVISLFFALFILFQCPVKAQEEYEKDSLESLLPYANDLQRADILNGLANCIRDTDSAKAYRFAVQSYTISNKLAYCKGKANAIITLGLLEKNKGNLSQARAHYLNGLLLSIPCNELSAMAFAYHCFGNLSFIKSDYKKSIQYYITSVKISEQIGDKKRAAKTYNNIGSVMLELGKLKAAEDYFLRALDLYKGTNNLLIIAKLENNLANIYQNKGYDLKALYHYLNALEVFRAKSSSSDVSVALGNIGLVYLKRNQVKKAMPFLLESFQLDMQLKEPRPLMLSISNLVEAYMLTGKYDSSEYYLKLGLRINQANPNISKTASLYESAAELYGKLHIKSKQDSFLNLFTQTKKQYLGIEKHAAINTAATEFENERNQQKIKLIEKENEINQLKIREQALSIKQRNILLLAAVGALVFLILLISLLIYLLHIYKKSKNFELSNQTKNNILNQLNHEIKTPLNGLVGLGELAAESKTYPELKEYLEYVKLGGEELVFMLNNLIVYLQLERKEAAPISAPFDLVQALDELFNSYKQICKNKGLLFSQRALSGIPRMVLGDQQKILIIIQNLLSNAVKQTNKGIVKVEVIQTSSKNKDDKKISTLQFSITDEGPGLSEKEIKNIFKETAKNSTSDIGLGIGLKNVKTLCDIMKATIKVVSEKGVGSTFTLEFELTLIDPNEELVNQNSNLQNKPQPNDCKILVVEDHQVTQFLFSKILEKEGYTFAVAENGLKALGYLKKNSFDLILMDIRMPVMNGIETATLIRNSSEFEQHRNIPIIAISAHDDSSEKKICFEIGINECINKPVKKEVLLKSIQNQLNK